MEEEKQEILKHLYNAVAQSNLNLIKEILNINPELLHFDTPNGSWLHVAARRQSLEVINYFIESGIDINITGGPVGSKPIDLAVSEGNIEIVEYFIKHGAVFDESAPEKNPLFAAIHKGHLGILKLLIKYGINTNVKYGEKTPISFAKKMCHESIIKYLEELKEKEEA